MLCYAMIECTSSWYTYSARGYNLGISAFLFALPSNP